ncbi:DsrE family protein [Microcystis sp. LEGE 00066]|uniref:DsrE family protein n=1 Tax=Microcystis sp. LEGE 00066 TaxID=1828685 RepID=UPI001881CFFF|nr:DsrE family protein [Microcystis sp. LEGE 00066]MBE9263096.1 DsrE family protein [Microcystis sp. LEGE 00066]
MLLKSLALSSLVGLSLVTSIPVLANPSLSPVQTNEAIIAVGQQKSDLFVNLTTDDPWRAAMAIGVATNMLKKGHSTTIFLNITGVHLAATTIPQHTNGITGKTLQAMLVDFISQGGKVLICPSCMKQAAIKPEDLIVGVVTSSPDSLEANLFKETVTVISW